MVSSLRCKVQSHEQSTLRVQTETNVRRRTEDEEEEHEEHRHVERWRIRLLRIKVPQYEIRSLIIVCQWKWFVVFVCGCRRHVHRCTFPDDHFLLFRNFSVFVKEIEINVLCSGLIFFFFLLLTIHASHEHLFLCVNQSWYLLRLIYDN